MKCMSKARLYFTSNKDFITRFRILENQRDDIESIYQYIRYFRTHGTNFRG